MYWTCGRFEVARVLNLLHFGVMGVHLVISAKLVFGQIFLTSYAFLFLFHIYYQRAALTIMLFVRFVVIPSN